ncbi:MAG: hypothetical protein ACK58M_06495 [Acidobacteriota bacterium]|jgi:hypothetical protein|nr:hypothetical protein [Acidobacteriaceae bacterium]
MHSRRILSFMLGVWFAGLVGVTLFTTFRPRLAYAMVDNPPYEAAKWIEVLTKERTATLLRHYDAEVGRQVLESWRYADLLLGTLLLVSAVMSKSGKPTLIGSALLLLLGLVSAFLLTPQVVAVGRLLDFRAVGIDTPDRQQFTALNRMFHSIGFLRFLIAAAMAALLFARAPRSRSSRSSRADQVDSIDYTYNGHINR